MAGHLTSPYSLEKSKGATRATAKIYRNGKYYSRHLDFLEIELGLGKRKKTLFKN